MSGFNSKAGVGIALVNTIPFISTISFLPYMSMFISNLIVLSERDKNMVSAYKSTVRYIAVGKIIVGSSMILYSLKDKNFDYKGTDKKCFTEGLEVPCFDGSKAINFILGESLLLDSAIDLYVKIPLGDFL